MGYKADEYRTSRKNPVEKLRADADLDMGIYIGEVIVTPKDESHSGRIPVYIPMLSKDRNDPRGYFNCYWSSPFAGTTPSAKVGPQKEKYQDTMKTYGMWMVPPDPGNFVLVIFGDGKKKNPIIIGCMFPDQMQNMVPGNPAGSTFGTDVPLPVAEKNRSSDDKSQGKNVQRPLNPYITYPIVKQGLIKDTVRGTTTAGARRESPSQVYGILTPGPMDKNVDTSAMDGTNRLGGHSFVMDDHLDQRHIRLRTAGGAQLLLDDTNEIVYVINSPGTAWVELSKDGSINVFSDEDLNMRSTSNINIRADHTVNIDGGVRVNINAGLLESAGSNVDTLKLGAETGGDIFIQSGGTINQLTNNTIKLETREGDITARTPATVALFGESSIKTKTTGSTTIQSGGDFFASQSGSGHIVSGGQSFVKGSTVHLNDGGSQSQGVVPGPITPLTVNIFKDEPMSIPVFAYDHENPGTKNPIPTGGVRKSDPGELPADISDPANNYKDERGEKIDVASTTTMITTREPWFNHLREDKTVPTPYTQNQQDVDRDLGRRYPPATSGTGYEGPDSVVNDDGTYELGTGFDGVKGGQLDEHVRKQYFDPTTGAPKTPTTAFQMTPDYATVPNMQCKTMAGGDLKQAFEGQISPALTDGISTSCHFSADEVPLSFAGDFDNIPPDMGGATVMGYKHILGEEEREAGCIMFGDGKNFDPLADTTLYPDNGAKPISASEVSKIIANEGPGKDLSKYGLQKASTVFPEFGSNDTAYVLKDNKMKSFITVNGNKHGISKQASKRLLANDLIQHGIGVQRVVKKPMSLGQMAGMTMLHHHLGPTVFRTHPVISLMNGSNNSTKKNIARMFLYDRGDSYDYASKGQLMSYLFQSSDKMWPRIVQILGTQKEWQWKASDVIDLHRQAKRLRPYS